MQVVYNSRLLQDRKKSLKDYGIKDGDLVMVVRTSSVVQRAAQRLQAARENLSNTSTAPMGKYFHNLL